MNRKTAYFCSVLVLLIYLVAPVFHTDLYANSPTSNFISEEELKSEVVGLSSNIDFRYTKDVREYINIYTKGAKVSTSYILGKVPIYFPIFEKMIREKNLPEELNVLPIIESHLRVNAKSSAGAAGLWQMIKSTARSYDLKVGNDIDERYSVELATNAALEFLEDLYMEFEDWTLALAAYNCGPGGVKKAIRKSGGSTDFWVIRKYLPRETRRYVPKFIAMSYILKHYKKYNLEPLVPEREYFQTAEAKVFKSLSFSYISKVTGLNIQLIKNLNNQYRRGYIPASSRGHKLVLPKNAISILINSEGDKYITFEKENDYNYIKYFENNFPRETIAYLLGDRYKAEKISVEQIEFRYFIPNYVGVKLDKLPSVKPCEKYLNSNSIKKHVLQAGETISDIASIYNIDIQDILRTNNISLAKPPRAGEVMIISN